jgi:hypothetical protein
MRRRQLRSSSTRPTVPLCADRRSFSSGAAAPHQGDTDGDIGVVLAGDYPIAEDYHIETGGEEGRQGIVLPHTTAAERTMTRLRALPVEHLLPGPGLQIHASFMWETGALTQASIRSMVGVPAAAPFCGSSMARRMTASAMTATLHRPKRLHRCPSPSGPGPLIMPSYARDEGSGEVPRRDIDSLRVGQRPNSQARRCR